MKCELKLFSQSTEKKKNINIYDVIINQFSKSHVIKKIRFLIANINYLLPSRKTRGIGPKIVPLVS